MAAAAHPGAAPGQVALHLAGLFCLKPTLSPEPMFPLPGGDRKNQGPRLDVSPPWHQREVAGGGSLWKNHEARSPTPNTNKHLASNRKGWARPTLPHQHPIHRGWAWKASGTLLGTEGQPWQPARRGAAAQACAVRWRQAPSCWRSSISRALLYTGRQPCTPSRG